MVQRQLLTADARTQWDAVRTFALAMPAAFEDFPWGIPAVKAGTGAAYPPVFVGLGRRDDDPPAIYVKLTTSYELAIAVASATPTVMSGLGQFGRLTIPLPVEDLDLLLDWVDESYRSVAPRRLVAELDRRPPLRGR